MLYSARLAATTLMFASIASRSRHSTGVSRSSLEMSADGSAGTLKSIAMAISLLQMPGQNEFHFPVVLLL